MRLDGVGERVLRSAFDFNRLAAIWGVDGRASWFTLNLQAELEQDQVSATDATQLLTASETLIGEQRVRFPAGSFLLWSARATATADLRDDPANTRRGGLFSLSAELVDDLAADFRDTTPTSLRTLKLAFNVSGYLPLGERVVLAGSLRGGDILPLKDGAQSIAPRRFFLGGASSMRGFREDGVLPADRREVLRQEREACRALVTSAGCSPAAALLENGRDLRSEGGNRFALAKLELRLPSFLFRSVDLGLFGEAGNLWLVPGEWDPFDLRYVAGTGLRVATPVGPVAFDVGFNLAPDETVNEQAVNVHFSVGLF
jgi:outer membrane protein assembly factor BamA